MGINHVLSRPNGISVGAPEWTGSTVPQHNTVQYNADLAATPIDSAQYLCKPRTFLAAFRHATSRAPPPTSIMWLETDDAGAPETYTKPLRKRLRTAKLKHPATGRRSPGMQVVEPRCRNVWHNEPKLLRRSRSCGTTWRNGNRSSDDSQRLGQLSSLARLIAHSRQKRH